MEQNTSYKKELHIKKNIHGPIERVFEAWTKSSMLAKWWGPKGFTNPICEIDPHKGGEIYIEMTGPDGVVYPMEGTVEWIDIPRSLIITTVALGKDDKVLIADLNTINFSEAHGETSIDLHVEVLRVDPTAMSSVEGMEQGWNESLDRLVEVMKNLGTNSLN